MKTDAQEEQSKPQPRPRPSRHATIMRGVVTPIFGLLAVACIVFGILNATVWKPTRNISAVADVKDTQYLVVDPGVLDLVDKKVTVEVNGGEAAKSSTAETTQSTQDQSTADANADDSAQNTTCIAIGSAKDVAGWLEGTPYTRITGLSTWTQLSTTAQKAQGTASTSDQQVKFADSEMWQQVQCGDGTAELTLTDAQPTQVALVDFGKSVPNADIDMHWTRQQVPNFALPWYFAGGLCAVLAVLCASVFAMDPRTRRRKAGADEDVPTAAEKRAARAAQREGEVGIGEAVMGSLRKFKPSKRTPGKPHTKHGRHGEGSAAVGEMTGSTPVVVDPGSRNLVAEHAGTADGDETAAPVTPAAEEPTAVITDDELAAYFARLSQEMGDQPADAAVD
ncbi:MAG: hypothetical protein UHD09_04865, partial [Bifidobacterium sp.]|nr:hypothetical protein [Bifidobacterium sp.]